MELRVLIIEDNEDQAELIKQWLKDIKVPQTTHVCGSGNDFQGFLSHLHDGATSAPNLVILDLRLPDVSGLELLESIRNTDALKAVPVIVYSASEDKADFQQAYKSGGSVFLPKSAKKSELLDVIQHLRLTGLIA